MIPVLALLFVCTPVMAKGQYLSAEQFLELAFEAEPEAKTLWLSAELKEQLAAIFGHPYHGLRLRYWQSGERLAWVMEELGKELPITIGVVVEAHQVQQLHIMNYRESRGGEVRHAFFTRQFQGARLVSGDQLDRHIDGITGATLSVRAVTHVAEAALLLSRQVLGATE